MFPILIDFGTYGGVHLFLPTYGVLFAAGAMLAWWWFIRRGRTLDVPDEFLFNLSFYALLAGILGAKVSLILVDWRIYLLHPRELVGVLRAAGVLMGGVIAGTIVFILYARRHDLPLYRLGDAIAAPLALGQAVGRFGCFSAGCCWGVHAKPGNPFAVIFTDPDSTIARAFLGIPLVPTQLMEATADLLLVGVLTWAWRRRLEPAGTVFWLYVLLYSILRGTIEFWRGDMGRGIYFGGQVSTSQLLSAAGIVVALAMLARGKQQLRQVRARS